MAKAFLQVVLAESGAKVFLAVDAVQAVYSGRGKLIVATCSGDDYHVDPGGLPTDEAAAALTEKMTAMSRDMADCL
jgi:hypothetical protein